MVDTAYFTGELALLAIASESLESALVRPQWEDNSV